MDNIYFEIIRDDFKFDPNITGTLTVDDVVVNDDVLQLTLHWYLAFYCAVAMELPRP